MAATVRCFLLVCVVLLVGCRLGHPPATVSYTPGPISTPSAEPGLDEALRRQLTAALAQRQALGEGPRVALTVLSAQSGLQASDGSQTVYTARLSVSVTLAGPAPRQVVLTGQRTFSGQTPLQASTARAAAFETLSEELMADAADWLLLTVAP